ncbi:MAG: hypothetical protein AABX11_07615 [Nanoarchaeota archaeon]
MNNKGLIHFPVEITSSESKFTFYGILVSDNNGWKTIAKARDIEEVAECYGNHCKELTQTFIFLQIGLSYTPPIQELIRPYAGEEEFIYEKISPLSPEKQAEFRNSLENKLRHQLSIPFK